MRKPLNRILASMLLAGGCALAQNPQVPAAYQTTYNELQGYLSSFDSTITSQWNGKNGNVLWSSELLAANANNGLQILTNSKGLLLEVSTLHSLGVRSVVVNMALPIADQNFYKFNGDPNDFQPMMNAYAALASEIHRYGMKMVVESALLFPGNFSANSGFNATGYFATLSDDQFVAARVRNVLAIAQQVKPDYINLNSEPDTDLGISGGRTALYGSPTAYAGMVQTMISQLHAAGVKIPLGAGIGTWLDNGDASAWVSALLKSGIDFMDLHVFPVNFNGLPALVTYTDMAEQAGIPVGIAEAWLLKESDAEYQNPPSGASVAGGETYYARDPFSFWAPLDQAFLSDLQKFASWKHLIYVSPFWTRYFWAYLDYNTVANLPALQITAQAAQAASAALASSQMTSTGNGYRSDTGGILQIPAVSGADFLTNPVAPVSTVSIFGANLSNGTGSASTLPLPTTLSTTTATIEDSSGNQQPLPFFFVSPGQINAAIPSGVSNGIALITFSNQGTVVGQSNVMVAAVAPALFTANDNGQGVPIGVVITDHADGSQTSSFLTEGSTPGNYTAKPISLGASGDQSVLQVYGTGIRGVSSLANVTATIGTTNVPVLYAGPCDPAHFYGLDQVNLALPHSLAGAGQVNLVITVNGIAAPAVSLDFE